METILGKEVDGKNVEYAFKDGGKIVGTVSKTDKGFYAVVLNNDRDNFLKFNTLDEALCFFDDCFFEKRH